ncbi:hypothetical protein Mgra_00002755 [Meloidogyne graminicola]|uniref:Uncharacterized protein n=1 Tax=Meloidogyne graminicola TaxID=189291 RepID=A0A8S9ZWZ1_9BILA|nr:hypothetical protein Mgra_00002755 [Meloidogyne graminicola]
MDQKGFQIKKWPSCSNLKQAEIISTKPATLGVPLTRSLSISGPSTLADALGMYIPSWTYYYYKSPNYRIGWPSKMFRNRFMCDRIIYDKHYSVTPIYRNIPISVPYHRTYEIPPKPLFNLFDPFDGPYRYWNKYGSKKLDENLNQKCYYYNKKHYFI